MFRNRHSMINIISYQMVDASENSGNLSAFSCVNHRSFYAGGPPHAREGRDPDERESQELTPRCPNKGS